ncbi:MAG: hypothetical protein HW377_2126 [Actinobacteria bacterium]|nr:hypothetical protein [Actinomycetota bacterium]
MAEGEADPVPFLPRCVERLEDLLTEMLRDARAGIGDPKDGLPSLARHAQRDHFRSVGGFHRLHGVCHEIEEHLFQQRGIRAAVQRVRKEGLMELDAAHPGGDHGYGDRIQDHSVYVDPGHPRWIGLGEIQCSPDHRGDLLRGGLRLPDDRMDLFLLRLFQPLRSQAEQVKCRNVDVDPGEGVSYLVGDSGRHMSEGSKLLPGQDDLLQVLHSGDVDHVDLPLPPAE